MQPLQYIISNNGFGIAVGVIGDPQQAHQEAILAENVYGFNHSDHIFNALIYMPSIEHFKKFLAVKEYFKIWDEHWTRNKVSGRKDAPSVLRFSCRAIKRAKLILASQVFYENFMQRISCHNNEYLINSYSDDTNDNN